LCATGRVELALAVVELALVVVELALVVVELALVVGCLAAGLKQRGSFTCALAYPGVSLQTSS
jgi:hypothetical protein